MSDPKTFRDALRREPDRGLLAALNSLEPESQRKIVFELGRRKVRAAIPILRRLLQTTSDVPLRTALIDALGRIEDPIVAPDLLTLLTDEKQPPQIRDSCAYALGRMHYKSAANALIRCLSDSAASVRLCAAAALYELADPNAWIYAEPLIATESDPSVKNALRALEEFAHSRRDPPRWGFAESATNTALRVSFVERTQQDAPFRLAGAGPSEPQPGNPPIPAKHRVQRAHLPRATSDVNPSIASVS
jgi:HEAT repeat protein